jgi:dihydrofolate reductase
VYGERVTPRLTLVLAIAQNGVIGANGALPWRLKSDMARFKAATMGRPVLMGRKTWDSLPKKPLPGRPNLILTRNPAAEVPGAWLFTDLEAMLAAGRAMAVSSRAGEICIIGGVGLYEATLLRANRIVLTEVALSPEGDARLALDLAGWREASRENVARGPGDEAGYVHRVLER